jgi:hypothetical protein
MLGQAFKPSGMAVFYLGDVASILRLLISESDGCSINPVIDMTGN